METMRSGKCSDELLLTPLELTDRIAQLAQPPRTHRHWYYGMLAPNSPLRGAVTTMAQLVVSVRPVQVVVSFCAIASSGPPVAATPLEPPPKASYVLEMGDKALHGAAQDLATDPRVIDTYLGAARKPVAV